MSVRESGCVCSERRPASDAHTLTCTADRTLHVDDAMDVLPARPDAAMTLTRPVDDVGGLRLDSAPLPLAGLDDNDDDDAAAPDVDKPTLGRSPVAVGRLQDGIPARGAASSDMPMDVFTPEMPLTLPNDSFTDRSCNARDRLLATAGTPSATST